MKKRILGKSGLILGMLMFMLCVPLASTAFAQEAAPKQAPHSTQAKGKFDDGKHYLEWGVFAIAAGEIGGAIGMGISEMRRQRRKEAKKVLVQRSTVPFKVRYAKENMSLH